MLPRSIITSLLALAFLAVGCEPAPTPMPSAATEPTIPFRKDGTLSFLRPTGEKIVTIDIEVAEGDSARARGMMQRDGLPDKSGMLFPMPTVERHSFWMANTPLSLDITFVGPDSAVVNTAKYTRPFSDASVVADGPTRWVVETEAGFTDTWGIAEGDLVQWALDEDM